MTENIDAYKGKYLIVNDEKIKEPLIYTYDRDLKFKYPKDESTGSRIDFWILLE